MKKSSFTIHYSIYINQPKEVVWDYTQNYALRNKWDKSILEAMVIQVSPQRIVRVKTKGNEILTFVYKLDDRPNKTTLAIQDVDSKWLTGGGGSWSYEDNKSGTKWSQTNTLVFKSNILNWVILPVLKFMFKSQMRKSMRRAKRILEQS